MSDSEQTTFTIKISKTHNFLDLPRETGVYHREGPDGETHTLTVKDGKVVKHEAVDSSGKALRTSRIRIASASYGPGYGPTPPMRIPHATSATPAATPGVPATPASSIARQ